MKKIFFVLILLVGFLSCTTEKKTVSSLLNFVPPETAIMVKMEDFDAFTKDLSENSFFSKPALSIQKSLQKKTAILQQLDIQEESALCFSLIGRDVVYTFITKNTTNLVPTNRLQNSTNASFEYDNHSIKKMIYKGEPFFSVVLNDVFIASDSKLTVENAIRRFNIGLPQNPSFQEIFSATSGDASIFVQNEKFRDFYNHFFPKGTSQFLKNFVGWTALDAEVKENRIVLNGMLTAKKAAGSTIFDIFQGMTPQKNQLAAVVPMNALGFYSFTYDDFSHLQENLPKNTTKTPLPEKLEGLFASANEIGMIYFPKGTATVLRSHDLDDTKKALLSQQKLVDKFRGESIFAFSEKAVFHHAFYPLLKTEDLGFYTRLKSFFVFAKERSTLENIIAHHQNGSVLASQAFYQHTLENLSDESSLLFMGINENLKKSLARKTADSYTSEIENLVLHGYKLSALQFVRSDGFSHVRISFQNTKTPTNQHNVPQIAALKLENPLAVNPQFFEYWRTNEQYIVVQDTENILYLFNNKGVLRWKKQLDGRILGTIKMVDLFKNTRLQMAFVTPHKFYVLDRNGNDVAPFPLKFNNLITQPLSIFDYANNRNYRFVVTQDKAITMWDNQGKKINGFEFNQTASSVLQAPKHIRIENKDYIVVPEASGKLTILDRQGNPRIKVGKTIDFSDNAWFLNKGTFTSTNSEGELVRVDESGKNSTKDLDLAENHSIDATSTLLVRSSENLLTINDTEITLDYGLYTAPKIFQIDKKTYIAITDTQARKVYLFDKKGNLLPGFPVYGNSMLDLGNMDNEGKLEFVVEGEDDSVLIYRLD